MTDDKNAAAWHCDDCEAGKSHPPTDHGISPSQLREKAERLSAELDNLIEEALPTRVKVLESRLDRIEAQLVQQFEAVDRNFKRTKESIHERDDRLAAALQQIEKLERAIAETAVSVEPQPRSQR